MIIVHIVLYSDYSSTVFYTMMALYILYVYSPLYSDFSTYSLLYSDYRTYNLIYSDHSIYSLLYSD